MYRRMQGKVMLHGRMVKNLHQTIDSEHAVTARQTMQLKMNLLVGRGAGGDSQKATPENGDM